MWKGRADTLGICSTCTYIHNILVILFYYIRTGRSSQAVGAAAGVHG